MNNVHNSEDDFQEKTMKRERERERDIDQARRSFGDRRKIPETKEDVFISVEE